MATDGPDPAPCDREVYEKGAHVMTTHSIGGSNAIERWVQKLARTSGQPVDWHFVGGRVVIKALGDLKRVYEAFAVHLPEHDQMWRKNWEQTLGVGFAPEPPRPFPLADVEAEVSR